MGVSIKEAAEKLGLDRTQMIVLGQHLIAPSACGRRLYRWDSFGDRFVELVPLVKKTINGTTRRPVRYSGHHQQRFQQE